MVGCCFCARSAQHGHLWVRAVNSAVVCLPERFGGVPQSLPRRHLSRAGVLIDRLWVARNGTEKIVFPDPGSKYDSHVPWWK